IYPDGSELVCCLDRHYSRFGHCGWCFFFLSNVRPHGLHSFPTRRSSDLPLTASCLSQVSWGRRHGRFFTKPKVGDLVMFGPGGGTRVEIGGKVSGTTITTIGGNTSVRRGGKKWEGNGVERTSGA